jgi:hypothetical protein
VQCRQSLKVREDPLAETADAALIFSLLGAAHSRPCGTARIGRRTTDHQFV